MIAYSIWQTKFSQYYYEFSIDVIRFAFGKGLLHKFQ